MSSGLEQAYPTTPGIRLDGLSDLRLAPFHLLAAESGVFVDRDHIWHLDRCDRLVAADPEWIARTDRRIVDVTDPDSQRAAIARWEATTDAGGEGMVVKPMSFIAHGRRGLVQPGVKCRGREYLRIIYGPEYADPSQVDRLRNRSLGRKRSLAVREFGLGVEALERFVRREPLYRVHESVFGVLALESEPVDPASSCAPCVRGMAELFHHDALPSRCLTSSSLELVVSASMSSRASRSHS